MEGVFYRRGENEGEELSAERCWSDVLPAWGEMFMLSVFFFLCVYSRECSAAALQGARRTPSVFVEEARWPAGRPGWPPGCFRQAGADLLPSAHLFALLHLLAFDLWPPDHMHWQPKQQVNLSGSRRKKKSAAPSLGSGTSLYLCRGFALQDGAECETFGCRWTASSSLTSSISPSGSRRAALWLNSPGGEWTQR